MKTCQHFLNKAVLCIARIRPARGGTIRPWALLVLKGMIRDLPGDRAGIQNKSFFLTF